MKFLPYENYTLATKLSPAETFARLRDNIIVTSRPISNFKIKTTRSYWGHLKGDSFEIHRVTWYANSFAPVITGQIHDDRGQTRIHIKMKMRAIIVVLFIIWMSGVTLALVASIIDTIESQKLSSLLFVAIAFYVIGYGLCLTGFKYESSKSKKILDAILSDNH